MTKSALEISKHLLKLDKDAELLAADGYTAKILAESVVKLTEENDAKSETIKQYIGVAAQNEFHKMKCAEQSQLLESANKTIKVSEEIIAKKNEEIEKFYNGIYMTQDSALVEKSIVERLNKQSQAIKEAEEMISVLKPFPKRDAWLAKHGTKE